MLRKWFFQASEIDRLTRELEDKERDIEFANGVAEWQKTRAKTAEELLDKERKGHITDLRKTADLLARQQKLPERFIKGTDDEPKPEPVETRTVQELDEIEWAARQMRQGDIDGGMENVPLLDVYIDKIKENPEAYIGVM